MSLFQRNNLSCFRSHLKAISVPAATVLLVFDSVVTNSSGLFIV